MLPTAEVGRGARLAKRRLGLGCMRLLRRLATASCPSLRRSPMALPSLDDLAWRLSLSPAILGCEATLGHVPRALRIRRLTSSDSLPGADSS